MLILHLFRKQKVFTYLGYAAKRNPAQRRKSNNQNVGVNICLIGEVSRLMLRLCLKETISVKRMLSERFPKLTTQVVEWGI